MSSLGDTSVAFNIPAVLVPAEMLFLADADGIVVAAVAAAVGAIVVVAVLGAVVLSSGDCCCC